MSYDLGQRVMVRVAWTTRYVGATVVRVCCLDSYLVLADGEAEPLHTHASNLKRES